MTDDAPQTPVHAERLHEARIEHCRDLADRSRTDLANNAFGSVQQITDARLARRYGMDARFDELSIRKAGQAMLRAGVEVAETLRAQAEGDFNHQSGDKLLIEALAARSAQPAPAPVAERARALLPVVEAGPNVSAEADRIRDTEIRRKVWEQRTPLRAADCSNAAIERHRPIGRNMQFCRGGDIWTRLLPPRHLAVGARNGGISRHPRNVPDAFAS